MGRKGGNTKLHLGTEKTNVSAEFERSIETLEPGKTVVITGPSGVTIVRCLPNGEIIFTCPRFWGLYYKNGKV